MNLDTNVGFLGTDTNAWALVKPGQGRIFTVAFRADCVTDARKSDPFLNIPHHMLRRS